MPAKKKEIVRREKPVRLIPQVDIVENENEFVLYADLPGVNEDTLDVTIERSTLTIKGESKEEIPEGYTLRYGEFSTGVYERSFTISEEIERDKIKASYKKGVLKLVLPKAETTKPKKIKIETSE